MNKELEETIERLNNFKTIKILYGNTFAMHLQQLEQLQQDIKIVLQALENSIPKSILRHKIQELEYDQLKNTGNIVEDRIKINFIKELLEGK